MMKKAWLFIALILLCASLSHGQTAPTPLPGYGISATVGYTSLQNAGNNNGMFSSLDVPLFTKNTTWSFTTSARADNFLFLNPGVDAIYVGPEERFQFSSSTFLGGAVFQPFGNLMAGAARSNCVAAMTCTAGQDTTAHFAYKIGAGVDVRLTGGMWYRIFEVDFHHSKLFPGGDLITQNFTSVQTAIQFRF